MADSQSLKVKVFRKGAPDEPIAQVELSAADMLSIASATPDGRADVEAFVARANAKPTISMSVSPPEEAERYELYSRAVERGEADYFLALREFAGKYFDLLLGGEDDADDRLAEQRAAARKSPPSEFDIDLMATPE